MLRVFYEHYPAFNMPSIIVKNCSQLINDYGMTVAFAESATAGRLTSEFSFTENSGKILKGSLVCYDASLKEQILGIDHTLIARFTPELEQVTKAMATRLREIIKSDIQVAVTGLISSGGSETEEKPVGTIFVHLIISGRSYSLRKVFSGNPEEIMLQAVDLAAASIIASLQLEY